MTLTLYSLLVFFHILLFVFWLGADLGVAILGAQFRNQSYSIAERITLLKTLTMVDMGPRSAWALMIGSTLSLLKTGGYWDLPPPVIGLAWVISFTWLWLVWSAHKAGQTPYAAKLKKIEFGLKWGLASFYLSLGSLSLITGAPIAPNWLASKALLFGFIFIAAILIDIRFKMVGPLLVTLIETGSSEATETPLLMAMNRTRFWVRLTYLLLVLTAFIGTTQFF